MSEKPDKRRHGFTSANARANALKAAEARKVTKLGLMARERISLAQRRRQARERAEQP